MLNSDNWKNFKDNSGYADSVIGGPTLEMWRVAWNRIIPEEGLKITYYNGPEAYESTFHRWLDVLSIREGIGYDVVGKGNITGNHAYETWRDADETVGNFLGGYGDYLLSSVIATDLGIAEDAFSDLCSISTKDSGWYCVDLGMMGLGAFHLRPVVCLRDGVRYILG